MLKIKNFQNYQTKAVSERVHGLFDFAVTVMNLNKKREEIDAIDHEMVSLLNRRAAIAREISVIKLAAGLPIQDETREAEMIRQLIGVNDGAVTDDALVRIFKAILKESREIQRLAQCEHALMGVYS